MKQQLLIMLCALLLILAGCTTIPQAYKDDPCANFCFKQDRQSLDPALAAHYDEVVSPICKTIPDYEQTKGMLIRISPTCNGENTYCDCQLADGTYLIKT